MYLVKKPNQWSCSLASFAMALDLPMDNLLAAVGHDGSDIVFPGLSDPMCRRGFHIQELIHVGLFYGRSVTPYEFIPAIQPTPYPEQEHGSLIIDDPKRKATFQRFIELERGVLTGRGLRCNHAVAFEKGQIFDPDGRTYPFSFQKCESLGFYAQCVWLVHEIL